MRIPSEGATGAAKIFHLIRRLAGDPGTAFARVARILPARSQPTGVRLLTTNLEALCALFGAAEVEAR